MSEQKFEHYGEITKVKGCKVLKAIPIVVVSNGEDCIAKFNEAGLAATGESINEAISNLEDIIDLVFHHLLEKEEFIAKHLKEQLVVLKTFVETT